MKRRVKFLLVAVALVAVCLLLLFVLILAGISPDQYDIHEYRIMEDYINDLDDHVLARALAGAIRGRGAFRRFKNTLIEEGDIQTWYDYRDQYYWKLARKWCKEHDLEFIED